MKGLGLTPTDLSIIRIDNPLLCIIQRECIIKIQMKILTVNIII